MLDQDFEQVLRDVLPASAAELSLDRDTDLRAAGLDSIGTIDLLMKLEARYDLVIPDTALNAATFATPGALWQVLQSGRGDAEPAGNGPEAGAARR
ncbi:phosphopantetheine-binding protein [Actinoallomurus sp. CA-150999]|uniref:phosphopantetheine-binding protein n=1 Tax=Actinoallomurus sp. CA-150999 TaxID=3239887 RepID=UPI003D92F37E